MQNKRRENKVSDISRGDDERKTRDGQAQCQWARFGDGNRPLFFGEKFTSRWKAAEAELEEMH